MNFIIPVSVHQFVLLNARALQLVFCSSISPFFQQNLLSCEKPQNFDFVSIDRNYLCKIVKVVLHIDSDNFIHILLGETPVLSQFYAGSLVDALQGNFSVKLIS